MSKNLVKQLVTEMKRAMQPKTQPYDTAAKVTRVENGTAWVHIDGGAKETPCKLTIDCKAGDTVQVRVSGGKAFLVGNQTAPPTDDHKANQAIQKIELYQTNVNQQIEQVEQEINEAIEDVSTVEGVTYQWCLSSDNSTFIQYGDWSDTVPTYVSGYYYWMRTVIEDDEGNLTYSDPQFDQSNQLAAEVNAALGSIPNHFWYDSTNGAVVSQVNKSLSSGYATQVVSGGIFQYYGGNIMSSWTNNGIQFNNTSGNPLASFGSGGTYLYDGNGNYGQIISSSGTEFYHNGVKALSVRVVSSHGELYRLYNSSYDHRIRLGTDSTELSSSYLSSSTETFYGTLSATADSGYSRVAMYAGNSYSGESATAQLYYGSSSSNRYFKSTVPYYAGSYKLLTIGTVTASSQTIPANSYVSGHTVSASNIGYTPIGVIGHDINGSYGGYVNIFDCYISGTNVYWSGRNLGSNDWSDGSITFYVLYVSSTQGT